MIDENFKINPCDPDDFTRCSLCFDIGAHIGNWSLQNINNFNKIIALEPSTKTFDILVKNCAKHNIICLNYAISNDIREQIDFYEADEASDISSINKNWLCSKESRFFGLKHSLTTCKSTTLDRLVELYGTPDLIKIDVEGAEDLVILSLSKKVKTLCFEWARESNSVTTQCIDHLLSIGFTKFYVQFEDKYSYVPNEEEYTDDLNIIEYLLTKELKCDWGMVWAI